MASSCTLTHWPFQRFSLASSWAWLVIAKANRGISRRICRATRIMDLGLRCERGQSPRHLKGQTNEKWTAGTAGEFAEPVGMPSTPQRAISVGNKLGTDRRDGVAVQHLDRPCENNRFLDLDMVGIELLEARGLGMQESRIFRA